MAMMTAETNANEQSTSVQRANDFIVPNAPGNIRYIPNFITAEEEEQLLDYVYGSPAPKWEQLRNRRLQNWGGIVNSKGMVFDGPLPQWLTQMIDKITSLPDTFDPKHRPNHVLINEYKPGQGIMPHTDGSAYFPLISTISLGSHTLLDFYEKPNAMEDLTLSKRFVGSMLVQPRSLLLINENAYQMHHGIAERTSDTIDSSVFNDPEALRGKTLERSTRVSLTIRNCPKVSKLSVASLLQRR